MRGRVGVGRYCPRALIHTRLDSRIRELEWWWGWRASHNTPPPPRREDEEGGQKTTRGNAGAGRCCMLHTHCTLRARAMHACVSTVITQPRNNPLPPGLDPPLLKQDFRGAQNPACATLNPSPYKSKMSQESGFHPENPGFHPENPGFQPGIQLVSWPTSFILGAGVGRKSVVWTVELSFLKQGNQIFAPDWGCCVLKTGPAGLRLRGLDTSNTQTGPAGLNCPLGSCSAHEGLDSGCGTYEHSLKGFQRLVPGSWSTGPCH